MDQSSNTWTTRISNSEYKKPTKTYTEKLSKDDIKDKLNGYMKVDDMTTVTLGTHIRYFQKQKDGTQKFRMGGFLSKNTGLPKYVVLRNNKFSWSVQITDAIFFRKMSQSEIIDVYEEKLEDYEKKIANLKTLAKSLKKERDHYKKLVK